MSNNQYDNEYTRQPSSLNTTTGQNPGYQQGQQGYQNPNPVNQGQQAYGQQPHQPYNAQQPVYQSQPQGYQGQPQQPVYVHQVEPKKKRKKHPFMGGLFTGIALTLVLCIVALLVSRDLRAAVVTKTFLTKSEANKLNTLSQLIDSYYYEDVDRETKVEGLYHGLLDSIGDKYTTYYSAEEYQEALMELMGDYAGIGAVLSMSEEGVVTVIKVYEGTPAEESGLQYGDVIIAADGNYASNYIDDLESFVKLIRGDEGTDVVVTYERDGERQDVTITRRAIEIPSVAYEMLEGNIGYIEIGSFYTGTQREVEAALEDLTNQGMEAIIFDLRDNGGGLVDSVVAILDDILPGGTVVYTIDGQGNREDYTSKESSKIELPIVVLTNENTASAAEIFAGAIRDFEYGTLVGTNTYGKGIVQSTVPLMDGSAIKITVSTYYTPNGESIHGQGIAPDVEVELDVDAFEDNEYNIEQDNVVHEGIRILQEQLGTEE